MTGRHGYQIYEKFNMHILSRITGVAVSVTED